MTNLAPASPDSSRTARITRATRTRVFRAGAAFVGATGLVLGLAACSGDNDSSNGAAGDDGDGLRIVTSTQVWRDVAAAVVGDAEGIQVDSIITSNDIDPHSYQPTAADMALVDQADILVAGGGHYDAWLTEAASTEGKVIISALDIDGHEGHDHGDHGDGHEGEGDDHEGHDHGDEHGDEGAEGAAATGATGTSEATSTTASSTAAAGDDHDGDDHEGHDHGDDEINEHIWYNTGAVRDVAHDLAEAINDKTDANVDDEDVVKQLDKIDERKRDIEAADTAQTHPLADDILRGTKIVDRTPEGYRRATLNEAEPSAADVNEMLELIESGDLDFLIDAPQTSDQVSSRLTEAAKAKGLRIIDVLEAPNAGETYFDLYNRILDELENV